MAGRAEGPDALPLELASFNYVADNPLWWIDADGLAAQGHSGIGKPIHPHMGEHSEGTEDLATGVTGLFCAIGVTKACLDPDLFICSRLRCTPKCGQPYFIEIPSKQPMFVNPETPCECVRKQLNPHYDKPLPGL